VRNSLGFAEVLQREDLCLAAVESSNQQLKTCVVIVNLRLQLHEVRQERLAFAVESGDVPSDWRQVKCFGVLHSLLSDSGLGTASSTCLIVAGPSAGNLDFV